MRARTMRCEQCSCSSKPVDNKVEATFTYNMGCQAFNGVDEAPYPESKRFFIDSANHTRENML